MSDGDHFADWHWVDYTTRNNFTAVYWKKIQFRKFCASVQFHVRNFILSGKGNPVNRCVKQASFVSWFLTEDTSFYVCTDFFWLPSAQQELIFCQKHLEQEFCYILLLTAVSCLTMFIISFKSHAVKAFCCEVPFANVLFTLLLAKNIWLKDIIFDA